MQSDFLQHVTLDHATFLEQRFKEDIAKHNLVNTRKLINSVYARTTAGQDNAVISFSIPFHGIFHDMKRDRSRASAEEQFWFGRQTRTKKPKHTPWYNKNVYGTIGRLIGMLVNGYSGEAAQSVKKHFPYKTI